jgi:hypothetical protein
MGLAEVSSILWREREMLEVLLFKLEEEQLVLASGRTRWLARATHEVEIVLEHIRETELFRAVEVDTVAVELGLDPNPSLLTLAQAASEPWRDILLQHRQGFMELTDAIHSLADANRQLLSTGARATRDALLAVGDDTSTYGRSGSVDAGTVRRVFVDEAI